MKILYISCHSIHEYDEIRMLRELGYYVYSPYRNYKLTFRPDLPEFVHNNDDDEAFEKDVLYYNKKFPNFDYEKNNIPEVIHKKANLTKEFVDRFDVVIVQSLFKEWIYNNWDNLKDKIIIWRTNGQSNKHLERLVKEFKKDKPNIKIMRYSPAEQNYVDYAGEDTIIRFGKKHNEWVGWTGKNKTVISLCQNVIYRRYACLWDTINFIGKNVPYKLYGHNNYNNPYWNGRDLEYSELQQVLKDYAVYFYNGTKPSCYTLNFIEAWMTGIPIISIGKKLGNEQDMNVFEVPDLIENGVSGFCSDDINELVDYCNILLNDEKLSEDISKNSRKRAIELFGYEKILNQWDNFLKLL